MQRLDLKLSPWSAPCHPLLAGTVAACGLPAARGQAQSFELSWVAPARDGEATQVAQNLEWPEIGFKGRITIFDVFPRAASGLPHYVQTRVEITAPVRALCLQSVRADRQIPPLLCSGYADHTTTPVQWGLNAEFAEFRR